jgi:predicted TIM-barrel fold metal-dependent hydrolase
MKYAFALLPLLASCATTRTLPLNAPLVDYHQHLVSSAFEPIVKMRERDGAALVRELDQAGITRSVVLSVGYSFADERKGLPDPDRLTREENDWTSRQDPANAPRLIGFCSANPLRPAALDELHRCLELPGMVGIKLHLGNGGISLRNPDHLRRIQQVFALAQRNATPILVHMRARNGQDYGAPDARLFIDQVLPMAPSSEVIVAHLGASSPGYAEQNDEVMAVFAEAAQNRDPRIRNLYVDTGANIDADTSTADAALAAKRMRAFGLKRVLYGSDLSAPGGSIRAGWELFRSKMPLSPAEFQIIASNRTRFVR